MLWSVLSGPFARKSRFPPRLERGACVWRYGGGMAPGVDLVRTLSAAEHGLATVTTTRPDGTVHASVVNAGGIDDPVTGKASVGVAAHGGTRKLDLFRRNGHATIVFRRGWNWVAVQGATHIVG